MKSKTQFNDRLATHTKELDSLECVLGVFNTEWVRDLNDMRIIHRTIQIRLPGGACANFRDTRVERQALIKQLKTLINKLEA
jgi:hypothetical protein